MSNKKIQINLDSFNLNKNNKTKKNRERKEKPNFKPLISPSILKNKLLKRIKDHKNKENATLDENNKNNTNISDAKELINRNSSTPSLVDKSDIDIIKYTDEFNDSMNYLQTLTKQAKADQEKEAYEKNKQKKIAELQRRTLKHHNASDSTATYANISLDLPESLKEAFVPLNTQHFTINTETPFHINNRHNATPPYGILKGGAKPTYRIWNKTQRANVITNPNSALIIDNKELTNRERRLQILKEKIKIKQQQEKIKNKNIEQLGINQNIANQNINPSINPSSINNENLVLTQNLIKPSILDNSNIIPNDTIPNDIIKSNINGVINTNDEMNVTTNEENKIGEILLNSPENQNSQSQNNNENFSARENITSEKIVAIKRKIKKTIRRRYTLGKSKIKKSVAILLKDNRTRKRVVAAHRELKNKSINDVKKYLREHNLIKLGSNAPNDVLRKLYESAMLSGEITNINKDIMLHNFMKEEIH